MQGRQRSSNDGRGYNSNYRRFNRSGSGGNLSRKSWGPPPPPPPQPRSKEEIFMEAGRLAAEYLVYKGLLPPNSLPPKWHNSSKFQNFKGQDRDFQALDGRTSALNRLGSSDADAGFSRRRYGEDYNNFRGKKRMDPYDRDWGRESGRWVERNRGYNNMEEEEEDEFGNGYQRDRRSGFGQLPSRSEGTVESGSENHDIAEDTGSKASSSSTRKEQELPSSEVDENLNKDVGDNDNNGKSTNSGTNDEEKSDASGDDDSKKKKNLEEEEVEEESNVGPLEHEGDSKAGDDLIKLCGFSRVPTRPRSSVTQRSPKKDEGISTEATNGESKVTSKEDHGGGSSNDSPANQTDTESQTHDDLSLVESVDKQQEGSQSTLITKTEEMSKKEGLKREREDSPEDEFARMHNLRAKQSSPTIEKPPIIAEMVVIDEEVVEPVTVDKEKPPVADDFFPKGEPELDAKMEEEEEKQVLPASFKICDLNLMGGPEITEIPDDPVPDHHQSFASNLETGKELSMDFGLSIGNSNNEAEGYSQLLRDDKVVQIIDLDDDCPMDGSASDLSKPKDEPIYPNLDSFLNQTEHADLPGIQDAYSLAISEFLGSDISRCPSVPSELNNLQSGMGLHGDEGVPNDDNSIYVSLEEIPIGYMDDWDQPPPEYGKFF